MTRLSDAELEAIGKNRQTFQGSDNIDVTQLLGHIDAITEENMRLRKLVKLAFEDAHYLGNRAPTQGGKRRHATVDLAWEDWAKEYLSEKTP